MLLQTERIMIQLGQDPRVAAFAQVFVTASLPGVLISGFNDSQKKFLNCFKKNYVPMTTNAIGTLLYPFWCLLFIIYLDMGIIGCAMADVTAISLTFVLNLLYTARLKDIEEAIFWSSTLNVGSFRE